MKIIFVLLSCLILNHMPYAQTRHFTTSNSLHDNDYTLDSLPRSWLRNHTLLKMMDDILPAAIWQLKNSNSCMNCNAGFSIIVHIDTVYILNVMVQNETGRGNTDLDEITIAFRFKSYLSIYDKKDKEISRLLVNDPKKDIYYLTVNNNMKYRKCSSPIVYYRSKYLFREKRALLVPSPTDDELIAFTRSKIKEVYKIFKKLKDKKVSVYE